jgi:hypothetical protein
MSYGKLGYIGLAKENIWGTPVTPSDYLKGLSESLTLGIDAFEVENIVGGFHEPNDVDGLRRITGDFVIPAYPVSMGFLLKGAMNSNSITAVASGVLWTSHFTTPKSEFAAGVARQPYTLEIGRDVGSASQFAGCCLDRLVMTLAPNQELRMQASWLGKAHLYKALTTPTYPGSSAAPFTFDSASLAIGGSANARVEALSMTIDNQLEGIPTLNASNTIARISARGPQMVRLSGTLDFPDITEHLDFINQTERSFKLSLFKANSFQFVIDVPVMVYRTFPLGMSGRGRNLVQFEARARFHTPSLTTVGLMLTTVKSNY